MDDGTYRCNFITTTKIYSLNTGSGAITNITRASGDYTGSGTQWWSAVAFANLLIAANKVDDIQKWDGVATNCVALGGSPPKAAVVCGLMTFLLLGDTNESGGSRIVRWSDNGQVEVWTGNDAGFLTLYQGPGKILNILPLGEVAVAYRQDSIHILYYVGSPFVFGQRQIFNDHGLIAPRAVCSLGNQHAYWGTDAVYLLDGVNKKVLNERVLSDMNICYDAVYRDAIHTVYDPIEREIYFFYPPVGTQGVCTKAWIYNRINETWRNEEVEAVCSGHARRIVSLTWSTIQGTWESQRISWDHSFSKDQPIILLGNSSGYILLIDVNTVNNDGAARTRRYESGIVNPGQVLFENPELLTTLETIEMDFEDKGSYNLEIWVGTQDFLRGEANLTWERYLVPMDGSVSEILIRRTAKYFTFRIQTEGSEEAFRGSGIRANFSKRGDR
jgi:hypothetical protein